MDKRKEIRLEGSHTVIVQLAAGSPAFDDEEMIMCHSVDFSSDGLQIDVDQSLEAGSIHPIAIIPTYDEEEMSFDESIDQYRFDLVAEVIWSKPGLSADNYLAGIKILQSEDTQYLEWKKWLLNLLTQSN